MVLLVAAMTVVIFGVAALVVDLGQARVVRGRGPGRVGLVGPRRGERAVPRRRTDP